MHNIIGRRIVIYEGEHKVLYPGTSLNTLVLRFKEKEFGIQRNRISSMIWNYLDIVSIKNHFIQSLNVREHLIHTCDVYPVFTRAHNIAEAGLASRLGLEHGTVFDKPLIEWHLKSKYLKDPVISSDHIEFFEWLKGDEMRKILSLVRKVNDILKIFFYINRLKPAMIELHFGVKDNEIMLVGDISPSNLLFWDSEEARCLSEEEAYNRMKNIKLHNW